MIQSIDYDHFDLNWKVFSYVLKCASIIWNCLGFTSLVWICWVAGHLAVKKTSSHMISWGKVVHDNWTSFHSARALAQLKVITRQRTAVEKNTIKLELIFYKGRMICLIYEHILYFGLLTVLGVLVFADENFLFVLWKRHDGNSVGSLPCRLIRVWRACLHRFIRHIWVVIHGNLSRWNFSWTS